MAYISDKGRQALREYQYKGKNLSLLYAAVLRPLAVNLTSYLPLHVAPNLLTLLGLFAAFFSFSLVSWYTIWANATLPAYVIFLSGVNLFVYQTLDNMDGQQARRTGTSSPLGQLFDHGCDAINTTISTLTFAMVIQLDVGSMTKLLGAAHIVFYFATWDEYFTGEMYLGYFNGADEVPAMTVLMYFVTAFYGQDLWLQKSFGGYQLNELIVLVGLITGFICCLQSVYRVLSSPKKQHFLHSAEVGEGGSGSNLLVPEPTGSTSPYNSSAHQLTTLFPLFCFVSFLVHFFLQLSGRGWGRQVKGFDLDKLSKQSWMFFTMMGFVFGHLVCRMILAHITKTSLELKHQKVLLIPLLLILCQHLGPMFFVGSGSRADNTPDIDTFLLLTALFSSVGFFLYVSLHVIEEITTELGIGCFVIKRTPSVNSV